MPQTLCLGIEGSANKVGVGIVTDDGSILANPRHTCGTLLCSHLPQHRKAITLT